MAVHEAEVFQINWKDMIKLFDKYYLMDKLFKHFKPFNIDHIGEKVIRFDLDKNQFGQ